MFRKFTVSTWHKIAGVEIIVLFIFTIFSALSILIGHIYGSDTILGTKYLPSTAIFIILFIAASLLFAQKRLEHLKNLEAQSYKHPADSIQGKAPANLCNNAGKNDSYKVDFFANICHDLKTPLTVILGTIQLMEAQNSFRAENDFKSSRYLIIIKHNCYRLLKLVNNILDISRLDSGHVRLNTTNINIVYFIEEIVQSVIPYGEQKGLYIEFDTEVEEIVTAIDIDKLERVILNLLSNAIKFTPGKGTINIKIYTKDKKVFISIKDSGPGIPKNKMKIIFERFKQINTSLTREFEGSGIGLSLVKSFVDLHEGEVTVNSNGKTGSEFLISLPVKLCIKSEHSGNSHISTQSRIIEAINIEFSDIYSSDLGIYK